MTIQLQNPPALVDITSLMAQYAFTVDYMWAQGSTRLQMAPRETGNSVTYVPQPFNSVAGIGLVSVIGARPRNEDSAVVVAAHFGEGQAAIPVILAAVADGLGGSPDGDVASAIAIQTVTESMLDQLEAFSTGMSSLDLSASKVEEVLMAAIRLAHYRIEAGTTGGSTTLTCALVIDRSAYIAHIGDCRAYLFNTGWNDMEIVTRDHRHERQWQQFGIASSEPMTTHPRGHVVTRTLGATEASEVDITRRNLIDGSRLLLCTNGIWENVAPEAMFAVVQGTDQPQDSCETLARIALANHAQDDMTALLVEMPGYNQRPASTSASRLQLVREE